MTKWTIALVLAFASSRFGVHAAGVRFDDWALWYGYHFADPELLRARLLESLYYMHMQPPLMNLAGGIALKLFPSDASLALRVGILTLSLLSYLCLFRLFAALKFGSKASFVLASIVFMSPAAIAYENLLFYSWPIACLMIIGAYALHRYLSTPTTMGAFSFFSVLAAVALTRSAWHFLWVVAPLAVFVSHPNLARTAIVGAIIPAMLVLSVYTKNFVEFGFFGSSSWMWLGTSRMVMTSKPAEFVDTLVRDGVLPATARVGAFDTVDAQETVFPRPPLTGIPILDRREKAPGWTNFNHSIFAAEILSRREETLTVVRQFPDWYLFSWFHGAVMYFMPPTQQTAVVKAVEAMKSYDTLWNAIFYGQVPQPIFDWFLGDGPKKARYSLAQRPGYFVLVAVIVAWIMFLRRFGRWCSGREMSSSQTFEFVIAATCCYMSIVGTLFEAGENPRFRFDIDALLFILVCLTVRQAVIRRKFHETGPKTFGALPPIIVSLLLFRLIAFPAAPPGDVPGPLLMLAAPGRPGPAPEPPAGAPPFGVPC
jgi:hypothetical protein